MCGCSRVPERGDHARREVFEYRDLGFDEGVVEGYFSEPEIQYG